MKQFLKSNQRRSSSAGKIVLYLIIACNLVQIILAIRSGIGYSFSVMDKIDQAENIVFYYQDEGIVTDVKDFWPNDKTEVSLTRVNQDNGFTDYFQGRYATLNFNSGNEIITVEIIALAEEAINSDFNESNIIFYLEKQPVIAVLKKAYLFSDGYIIFYDSMVAKTEGLIQQLKEN